MGRQKDNVQIWEWACLAPILIQLLRPMPPHPPGHGQGWGATGHHICTPGLSSGLRDSSGPDQETIPRCTLSVTCPTAIWPFCLAKRASFLQVGGSTGLQEMLDPSPSRGGNYPFQVNHTALVSCHFWNWCATVWLVSKMGSQLKVHLGKAFFLLKSDIQNSSLSACRSGHLHVTNSADNFGSWGQSA